MNKNKNKLFLKLFWFGALVPVALGFSFIFCAWMEWFGEMPDYKELENPENHLATQIVTSDGQLLGKYFFENRTQISFEQLSPDLVNALVATEDERYFNHSGIDVKALLRAVKGVLTGSNAGGGSTITQQLAKMLYSKTANSKWDRIKDKFREWVIAIQLERRYTKEEIIAMYLNRFDFLNLAVGIESASKTYFDTTPLNLTIEQAATLVGMAKNPSLYNPVKRLEKTQQRRNIVFNQMERNKYLSKEEADSLSGIPIELKFKRAGHNEGPAPYFREYLRIFMKEWVKNNPKPDGSEYNIYTDGLKIYTTIDSRMQEYAEEATREHLSNLQRVFYSHWNGRKDAPFYNLTPEEIELIYERAVKKSDRYRNLKKQRASESEIYKSFKTKTEMTVFSWSGDIDTIMTPMDSIKYYKYFLQAGFVSIEPKTGHIKAWVGGNDHTYFKYDHVKKSKRQVGSTFKPIVYAAAIDQKKWSPCYEVPNSRVIFEKEIWGLPEDWSPRNSDGEYGGMLTLKSALAGSINSVTAHIMKNIGPQPVVDLANNMGFTSEIPALPSICLGTPDLSIYEMAGAYNTFANKGIYVEPTFITRIEDKNGVTLQNFYPLKKEVMTEETAYVMLNLLEGVTEQGGTAIRLRLKEGEFVEDVVTGFPYSFEGAIAGKTGTTQNNSDGWFMGIVPGLVSGVWVGCEDRSAHFRSIYFGQGATMALPIWALYMKKVYEDDRLPFKQQNFKKPHKPISIELDCDIYNQNHMDNFNFD